MTMSERTAPIATSDTRTPLGPFTSRSGPNTHRMSEALFQASNELTNPETVVQIRPFDRICMRSFHQDYVIEFRFSTIALINRVGTKRYFFNALVFVIRFGKIDETNNIEKLEITYETEQEIFVTLV